MSYQTGTATSVANFLSILNTFLIAQGYTSNRLDNDGTYERLNISKNGFFYNIYGASDHIILTLSSGYAAVAKGAQADETLDTGARRCETNAIGAGTFTAYHIFYDTDFVHVVIESTAGLFNHFVFGEIAKYGTWSGGAIVDALFWATSSTYIDNPDVDSQHNILCCPYNSSHPNVSAWLNYNRDSTPQYSGKNGTVSTADFILTGNGVSNLSNTSNMYTLWKATPTSQTSRVITLPLEYMVSNGTDGRVQPVGYLPFTRSVNMQLLNPNDVIDTDWHVFPYRIKRDPAIRDDTANSGYYAYAIKQIA